MRIFRRIMLASGEVPETQKIYYTATAKVEPTIGWGDSTPLYNIWNSVTNAGVIVYGEDITKINANAFKDKLALTSIIIPNNVVTIGNYAFNNCKSLEEITIGKSVHNIDLNAFYGTKVKKVNINQTIDSFLSIEYSNYSNNYSYLPLSNAQLYLNGNLLTDLVIPEGVTTILKGTLYAYAYLQSISIPASVTEIQTDALKHCKNLSYINVDDNNSIFDSRDNCNCLIETSNNTIVLGSKNSIIPESVLDIKTSAFNAIAFDKSFIIPNTVSLSSQSGICKLSSGPELIVNCNIPNAYNLVSGDGVFNSANFDKIIIKAANIGICAFNDSKVKYVVFRRVEWIGQYAFSNCAQVKYYDFSSCTTYPTIATKTFDLNRIADVNCKIIVPDFLYDDWIAATNWSEYADYIIKKSDWDASQVTE